MIFLAAFLSVCPDRIVCFFSTEFLCRLMIVFLKKIVIIEKMPFSEVDLHKQGLDIRGMSDETVL